MPTRHFNTQSLANFAGIPSNDVWVIWGSVSGLIQSGLAEGESLDAILDRLTVASCQLWVAYTDETIIAACVTEIVTIAGRKVFNIISVGGYAMNCWLDRMATLEAFARSHNCSAMRFPEIRPGWQRVLKDFTVTKITLEKAL